MSVVELEQDQITDFFLKILVVLKHSIIKKQTDFLFLFFADIWEGFKQKIQF